MRSLSLKRYWSLLLFGKEKHQSPSVFGMRKGRSKITHCLWIFFRSLNGIYSQDWTRIVFVSIIANFQKLSLKLCFFLLEKTFLENQCQHQQHYCSYKKEG